MHLRKSVDTKRDGGTSQTKKCYGPTADIIHSTHYSPRRRRQIDQVLRKSFNEVIRKYPKTVHTRLAFRITAGDEFQCVFLDVPKTLEILTYLRALAATSGVKPIITFRASIGVGEISVSGKSSPYEEDGQAFVRSASECYEAPQCSWMAAIQGSI